jgi:hypothetical protein
LLYGILFVFLVVNNFTKQMFLNNLGLIGISLPKLK